MCVGHCCVIENLYTHFTVVRQSGFARVILMHVLYMYIYFVKKVVFFYTGFLHTKLYFVLVNMVHVCVSTINENGAYTTCTALMSQIPLAHLHHI